MAGKKDTNTRQKQTESKELEIVRAKDGYLIEVQYKGGGQLPKELKGKFMNEEQATKAIRMYLRKMGRLCQEQGA